MFTAQPDLWVFDEDEHISVLLKIGIARKHPAYVDILLTVIRKAAVGSGYKDIRARNVLYLNVTTGREMICESGLARFNRTFASIAKDIAKAWANVTPPEPVDGRAREVMSLKIEFMRKVNATAKTLGAGVSLVEFVEQTFLPELARRGLSPSTVNNYKNMWAKHLKVRAAGFRVRDFRTCDGESLMQAMGRQYGNDLAHGTYCRIKSLVSAIFTAAKRSSVYDGVNPMTGVSIPKGRRHGRKTHAYSLIDISQHIALFNVAALPSSKRTVACSGPKSRPPLFALLSAWALLQDCARARFGDSGARMTKVMY